MESKQEKEHFIQILKETKSALKTNNYVQLQTLSDKTIHTASIEQHTDAILIAILIYTLSKIVARRKKMQIKNWNSFVNKFNTHLDLAIKSLENDDQKNFLKSLENAKKIISNLSINLKPYLQEVLKKASINKASKIFEHGISLEQTAKLLGVTKWELSEYIGQKNIPDTKYNLTMNTKRRAEMALKFFTK